VHPSRGLAQSIRCQEALLFASAHHCLSRDPCSNTLACRGEGAAHWQTAALRSQPLRHQPGPTAKQSWCLQAANGDGQLHDTRRELAKSLTSREVWGSARAAYNSCLAPQRLIPGHRRHSFFVFERSVVFSPAIHPTPSFVRRISRPREHRVCARARFPRRVLPAPASQSPRAGQLLLGPNVVI
jgi:hypothetical protein